MPSPLAVLLAGGLATGVLTSCSSEQAPAPAPEPTQAALAWNPCTGLELAEVSELFATTYAVRTGTPDAPSCTFSPQTDGDPAVDVNYQLVVGTLGELLGTFGDLVEGGRTAVASPTVPGADDARLIVDVADETLTVTGFVQNGGLVQIVNALDPQPYDRRAVLADVEAFMALLAAGADSSGLTQ